MGLLVNDHDDVSWLDPGQLVPLPVEDHLLAVGGAFGDFDVEELDVLGCFGSFALLAFLGLFDLFASAEAFFAGGDGLCVHAGADHGHGLFHTLAFAV